MTINWAGKICLAFKNGEILHGRVDKLLYPEYFPNDCEWPVDPETGIKLQIYGEKFLKVRKYMEYGT